MPQMGYDMREGTVVRWLMTEGDEVKVGDAVAEIETDKAVVEFESTDAGILRKILVSEGTTADVGTPIAIVGTADEEIVVPESAEPPSDEGKTPDEPESIPLPPPAAAEAVPPPPSGEVRASPVAKRLAAERGIDLAQLQGTGPGGRITRKDILDYEPSEPGEVEAPAGPEPAPAPPPAAPEPAKAPAAAAPTPAPVPGEKVPLTRMRQQIARVTVKSKQEIPHFYVSTDVEMSRAMDLRKQVNADLEDSGVRVSVNDLIIKACVGALIKYPRFNASFADDAIQMNEAINVGIAIAEDEGLIVPAIMDCGGKSLAEIAVASKDLIERSKGGTLHAEEYTGGTFAISNLGMFDVSSFAAIIQPPQSAVLAVGRVEKRPVVNNGDLAVAQMMTATLSVDHRVSDGAEGARFVAEVKRLLEHPINLLV